MGFFEILLIAVVTLLVVGPERMPEAVRNIALTIGRLKRSFNSAREEIEKQIGADDIRRQLHNEAVMESLEKIKNDIGSINPLTNDQQSSYNDADDQELPDHQHDTKHQESP